MVDELVDKSNFRLNFKSLVQEFYYRIILYSCILLGSIILDYLKLNNNLIICGLQRAINVPILYLIWLIFL